MRIRFGAAQSQGRRPYQEDDYRFLDLSPGGGFDGSGLLMVLADGMGGHAAGAAASALTVETTAAGFPRQQGDIPERLTRTLDAANRAIACRVASVPEDSGMGCTFVAVALVGGAAHWVSVGDSPLWLVRAGVLSRLNADHSMAPVIDLQAQRGEMSPRAAAMHPYRNVLRSAVMGQEIKLTDRSEHPLPILENDLVLLASDGLLTLGETGIAEVLGRGQGDPQALADDLVAAVDEHDHPHQDNTTVLIARAAREDGGRP